MAKFDPTPYQLIADALHGDGGFSDGAYLVQYPRESSDKFDRRKEIAWYANAIRPACQRFVGYLTKRPPFREVTQPAFTALLDSCNWQNDNLDVFWSQFMIDAKARGCMLLLVDMPPEGMETDRTWPLLSGIAPEIVTSYILNEQGQLASVSFRDTMTVDDTDTAVTRVYDETGWKVIAGDKTVMQGQHNLGVCPVLAFVESGLFPNTGEFATIASLSKRLYNLRSELDEILRAQTFSLLTYKVPEDRFPLDLSAVAQSIGTHNLLQTFPNGAEFIAPPEGPARVYLDVIAQVEALIRQAALMVDIPNSNNQESGVALQLRFQALNASLVAFARRMEDLERRMWQLAGLWLGMDAKIAVNWGKDYSISDLKTEIEVAQNIMAVGAPPTYLAAKLKQLIHLDLATLPEDELEGILVGVDEVGQEIAIEPPAVEPGLPA